MLQDDGKWVVSIVQFFVLCSSCKLKLFRVSTATNNVAIAFANSVFLE